MSTTLFKWYSPSKHCCFRFTSDLVILRLRPVQLPKVLIPGSLCAYKTTGDRLKTNFPYLLGLSLILESEVGCFDMEIVHANCATLSNYEVLKHLQKIKDSKKKHKGQLATITYETIRYLENTPCNDQTSENIKECLSTLAAYNLNKTEKLMIINSPPTTALEIQLMIEESEERLSEEQVEKILETVMKYFPHVVKEKADDNDGEEPE